MKVKKVIFPTKPHPKKHGFAIIATMTLMILLATVAVGLMALASSQSRIAMQSMLTAAARQQALVGLDAAIGQLQTELGPDQRVSANSGILATSTGSNVPNAAYILGVWNSWDGPIYGASTSSHGNSIKKTYDQGRSSMFRRWLISSVDKGATSSMQAYSSLSSREPGKRICLVGEGTIGRMGPTNNYIYADLLSMPTTGNNIAQFAWWVGAENQKAKANTAYVEPTSDTVEILTRTWDTPSARFLDNDQLRYLPETIKEPGRLLSLGSLPLLADGSREAGAAYFFDVTTSSYSLATDARSGGLKKDLCLLLNKKTLSNTDYARRANQDCPIVEQGGDVPQASERSLPIGSWQTMHAYYNTWPDGSGSNDHYSARLQGGVTSAYTRLSGDLITSEGGTGTGYDSKSLLEGGSKTAGYARVPVMIAYLSNFVPILFEYPDSTSIDFQVSLSFGPTVLWWNPYNVPMKIAGKKLWTYTVPYRTLFLQSKLEWKTGSDGWAYHGLVCQYYNSSDTTKDEEFSRESFNYDYGSYFVSSYDDESADIEFQPGEVLYFSKSKSSFEAPDSRENHMVLGYHPEALASNAAHFLGSSEACKLEDLEDKYITYSLRFGIDEELDSGSNSLEEPTDKRNDLTNFTKDYMERIGGNSDRPDITQIPTLSYVYGYNDMTINDNDSYADIYNGKQGVSPSQTYLSWYDPKSPPESTVIMDATYEVPIHDRDNIDTSMLYPAASVGFTIKSSDAEASTNLIPGDFRSKIWQHSSPAFFGSQIYNPSNEQRAYHPFQLSTLDVSGSNHSPLSNLGNNGTIGATNYGEQASYAATAELPVHPPFSLAGFAGMRLTPGWYKTGSNGSFVARHASMQYQMGVPSNGIGNSYADPTLPMDDVYSKNLIELPDFVKQAGGVSIFNDCYDHGLLINDALWDSYFCSSISDRPLKSGKIEAKTVLTEFLSGKTPLPVSRYKKSVNALSDNAIIQRLMDDDGWKYVAQYIVIDGGFNVNSTSVEAWTAVLLGLAKRELVSNVSPGKLSKVEANRNDTDVIFSRFMLSTTDKSLDAIGRFSMMRGSSGLRKSGNTAATAWGEVRKLSSDGIRRLADEMVKQVRLRGPFLSMSDFINRRLDSGSEANSLKGALQTAIDNAGINSQFDEFEITTARAGGFYKFPAASTGSLHTGAPGYLIQSDVLTSLGNILTVRDDTFIVRSYGCIKNKNNAVLAQAWCEATVQRCVEYVDPANAPSDSDASSSSSRKSAKLSQVNQVLGRKFKIVSFKWLDNWDI